ncbi:lipoprotein signal peptidase [SAR116 cluster alpha proteobacterium HIMB100]|nr:lipoprotein signal peptidase [SAR116 cluster alpha proteobacterium HIMB100]
MRWPVTSHIIWFLAVSSTIILFDQLSKNWMLELIFSPARQIVLTPFLNLTPVWNSGISFGLFQDNPMVGRLMIPLLAVLVVLWLFFSLYELSRLQRFAAGLIAGGAIGNVIDRIRFERVVDFLDFHVGTYHWPAFNLADSAIFMGVVFWIFAAIVTAQPRGEER